MENLHVPRKVREYGAFPRIGQLAGHHEGHAESMRIARAERPFYEFGILEGGGFPSPPFFFFFVGVGGGGGGGECGGQPVHATDEAESGGLAAMNGGQPGGREGTRSYLPFLVNQQSEEARFWALQDRGVGVDEITIWKVYGFHGGWIRELTREGVRYIREARRLLGVFGDSD